MVVSVDAKDRVRMMVDILNSKLTKFYYNAILLLGLQKMMFVSIVQ